MKRIFIIFLALVFILSLAVSVFASFDRFFVDDVASYDDSYYEYDFYYDDAFVSNYSDFTPLTLPSGYSVTAFVGYSSSVDYNPVSYGTSSIKRIIYSNNALTLITLTFGYVITLPPTSQSGYVYVSGILPVYALSTTSTDVTNEWTSPPAGSTYIRYTAPMYYFLSDDFVPYTSDFSNFTDYSPIGSFYVPAHDNAINLYAVSYYQQQRNNNTMTYYGAGAYMSPNASVYFIPDSSYQTSSDLSAILDAINNQTTVIENDPMSKFEDRYLTQQQDQLNQVEEMLTSANPALPNNGDFAGFASDISDGLGLSGSSFNPSDFSSATSKFGDTSSTSAGGPWEFFSQSVLDSLSGDTYSVGLSDDDYIYAWLDDMIRWRDSAFGGG